MKKPKKYLHLHTRLEPADVVRLRQGLAALRALDPHNAIRNYADFTRTAIYRFAGEALEAHQEQQRKTA